MPAPWPRVPLGEVLRHRKEFIPIDDTASYQRCRVQLHAQGVVPRDEVAGAEIKTKRQQVCRAGEFLVAEIDAKVGGFGLVPPELDGAIVSSHYFLYGVDEAKLDRRFLDYYVRTRPFREQVEAQGSTNYAAIRPADVLGYTVPLPPVAEQRRVVARVDAVAARLADARRLRDEAAADQLALVSSLHLHSAGDRRVTLGDLLELDEDRVEVRPDGLYPQVGVNGFGGGLFPKEELPGTATTYRNFNRLYPGAVVLSQVKGWEGAIAVCPDDLAGRFSSPEYRTFRCRTGQADPRYFAALLTTPWFWQQLAGLTRGVGARRERVRPELFLALDLPFPTIDRQQRAIGVFDRLGQLRPLQAGAAADLDALLPAVLARAFAGDL
ncbi:MAG: hypothetical protein K2X87_26835 [Gemmataceae bacterium]|nr:hypothetical protein [Gemmataceae bacterium]